MLHLNIFVKDIKSENKKKDIMMNYFYQVWRRKLLIDMNYTLSHFQTFNIFIHVILL